MSDERQMGPKGYAYRLREHADRERKNRMYGTRADLIGAADTIEALQQRCEELEKQRSALVGTLRQTCDEHNAKTERIAALETALRRAHPILQKVSVMGAKIGVIATHAQSASWQIKDALTSSEGATEEKCRVCKGDCGGAHPYCSFPYGHSPTSAGEGEDG